jgi:nucleoside-diphosphate-sugar epimerase
MKSIGIVGLGWLGLPLAKHLIQHNFNVKGTVTSLDKMNKIKEEGIDCKVLNLNLQENETELSDFFSTCDYAIITIPPNKTLFSSYENVVLKAFSLFNDATKVIFTSSTSIYSDTNADAVEDSIKLTDYNFTSQLFLTEKAILKKYGEKSTILRLGGLIGDNRHPVKYLSGKSNLPNPTAPINVVHQEDVIEIIKKIIEEDCFLELFNVCCDNHQSRKEFYDNEAKKMGIPALGFINENSIHKKVNNQKLKKKLNFEFKYNFFD